MSEKESLYKFLDFFPDKREMLEHVGFEIIEEGEHVDVSGFDFGFLEEAGIDNDSVMFVSAYLDVIAQHFLAYPLMVYNPDQDHIQRNEDFINLAATWALKAARLDTTGVNKDELIVNKRNEMMSFIKGNRIKLNSVSLLYNSMRFIRDAISSGKENEKIMKIMQLINELPEWSNFIADSSGFGALYFREKSTAKQVEMVKEMSNIVRKIMALF